MTYDILSKNMLQIHTKIIFFSREQACCRTLPGRRVSCIPRHVCPSAVNPLLQEHENEPSVLTQAALMSHGGFSAAHSSMSKENNGINDVIGRG